MSEISHNFDAYEMPISGYIKPTYILMALHLTFKKNKFKQMKLTFNKTYFILFLLLFTTEVVIAIYLKDGFIRHTFGDYLVVILMYYFIKSFIKNHWKAISVGVLIFAYIIEGLQAFSLLKLLQMQHNHLANLILGSTFSIADLVAYTFGFFTIIFVEFELGKTN